MSRPAVLPPQPVRRLVIAPVMVLCTVVVLALTPLLVFVAALAVRWLPGRWRGLRLLWFLFVYLVRESVGLIAMAVLWVVSGFGLGLRTDRMQRAHVVLAGWYLHGVIGTARRVLGLQVVSGGTPDHLAVDDPFRPDSAEGHRGVLVFSRHAGAGDSFILADLLLNTYGRRPRIVLKDLLQFDPCVDTALNRIPSAFISPNPPPGAGVIDAISRLASGIGGDDALILFPEGGNFTEERRTRAIERLRDRGLDVLVPLAEELSQVLPPRPGGVFAAIDAAPAADVLFVAHTGLEQLSSPGDLWRGLPMRDEVRMAWWSVPAEDVPDDPDERMYWLYAWWEHIDTWIEQNRIAEVPAGPRVAADGG